jgi:O-antigen/teichoic acid export membrane protein
MMSGVSSSIINLSKYYRYNSYFTIAFGLMVIVTNLIFIPVYGITGAALAAFISSLSYHLIQMVYLYFKFGLFPFDLKIVIVLLITVITYLLSLLLPELPNFIPDILVRSILMTIVFGTLIMVLKVSKDVDNIKIKVIAMLRSFFR